MLRSVPIGDGKFYQGPIGEMMKQKLLAMYLAIDMVCN